MGTVYSHRNECCTQVKQEGWRNAQTCGDKPSSDDLGHSPAHEHVQQCKMFSKILHCSFKFSYIHIHTHIHTHPSSLYLLQFSPPHQEMTDAPQNKIESLQAEGARRREAAGAGAAPSLCVFPLQSRVARRLTHSLWDTLHNSLSGNCGWIPNENRSSLCFINCCYYRHFQIPLVPPTNRQPCRCVGAVKRREMLVCHCSSATAHFLCNWCGVADMHVEAFAEYFVAWHFMLLLRKTRGSAFTCTGVLFFLCCRGVGCIGNILVLF